MMKLSLVPHINHTALHRTDNNAYTFCSCMNHLASANINTAMSCVYTHIARLRIAYLRPCKECICSTQTAVTACQTIAYKTGAVKCSRGTSPPYIFCIAYPAVCTVNNRITCKCIIAWFRLNRCLICHRIGILLTVRVFLCGRLCRILSCSFRCCIICLSIVCRLCSCRLRRSM